MSVKGMGAGAIARYLNRNRVPVIGDGKSWHSSYIRRILTSRSVLGEYQPMHLVDGERRPNGPLLPNHYPRIMDDETWYRSRGGMVARKHKRGRKGTNVANLFSGIIHDARDGYTMRVLNSGRKPKGGKNLVSQGVLRHEPGTIYTNFPYELFEMAFFTMCKELTPEMLFPQNAHSIQAEIEMVRAIIAENKERIARIKSELLKGDVASLSEVLRELERILHENEERLERLLSEANRSDEDSLRDVIDLIDKGQDDPTQREKLQGKIREFVESIWLWIDQGGRGITSWKKALCQVFFRSGSWRLILMEVHPKDGFTWGSLTDKEQENVDLRTLRHKTKNGDD